MNQTEALEDWTEVLEDRSLQNLPYKIETNRFGQIVMSPASNLHGIIQNKIGTILANRNKLGQVISECSVVTAEGVKVADIAWASEAFFALHGAEVAYTAAPELCVEIRSPSNSSDELLDKKKLYFQSGAQEVWISDLRGRITFFDANGQTEDSRLFPGFPTEVL